LKDQRNLVDAVVAYQKALKIKPGYALAHTNLGAAFFDQGKLADAEAAHREAIKNNPYQATAYNNLGNALGAQGELEKAVEAFHKAIELDPKDALPYFNLGTALRKQGKLVEAVDSYKEAIKHKPGFAAAHHFLRLTERLIELDTKLSQVLDGQAKPAGATECADLADLCRANKHLYVAATHLYQEAFTAQPALADDMQKQYRYNAACAAALAGCGQGKDAGNLGEEERQRLRRQALTWLRADLKAYDRQLDNDASKVRPSVAQRMRHWPGDMDFAGVRGPEAFARLPAAERQEWQKLWEDVAALRRRVEEPPKPDNTARP
jgi:tetratricopeptide (TPR) repeat protein